MNEMQFFNRGEDKSPKANEQQRPLSFIEFIGAFVGQAPNWLVAIALSTGLLGVGFAIILLMGWK